MVGALGCRPGPGRAAATATAMAVNDRQVWDTAKDSRSVGRQKPNTVEGERASWEAPQQVGAGSCGPQGAEPAARKTALWLRCLINP